jgi:hypothetical protein
MKIHPVGAELFHANRKTDRRADRNDEAKSLFWQCWERAYLPVSTYCLHRFHSVVLLRLGYEFLNRLTQHK